MGSTTSKEGFSSASTGKDIINHLQSKGMTYVGKVALCTGGNSGIGLDTVECLAAAGFRVYLAARNEKLATSAIADIRSRHPQANVTFLALDLTDLKSVSAAAERFLAEQDRLDLLVNNAGVMATPFGQTKDGYELQFGTNHLGHFHLTNKLLPALRKASGRVVNVSSAGNYIFTPSGGIVFDDLDGKKHYDPWARYSQSKLANILHARELQRRSDANKWGITAVSLHPGAILGTNLLRHSGFRTTMKMMSYGRLWTSGVLLNRSKTIPQGSATSLYAGLMPDIVPGGHYSDCQLVTVGKGFLSPYAEDVELAQRLWTVSDEMVAKALQ